MTNTRTIIGFLCKALFLCLVLTVMSPGVAEAKLPKKTECSANGQPPCPVFYKGPICEEGLGNFGGTCRPCGRNGQRACPVSAKGKQCFTGIKIDGRCYASCGGPNEKACPKLKSGYPCRGNYEPDGRGFCRPCGGNGQTACRALKAGAQCRGGLTKIDGVCQRCGGEGERACPVLKAGKRCEGDLKNIGGTCQRCGGPNERACPKLASGYPCRGSYEPDGRGVCRPCGGEGQKACRALKVGKQCVDGTHKIDGVCQQCGGPNQRACPKIIAGFPCRGSFEPDSRGVCKPCGAKGQKACRVLKAGRQCAEGSTERGGVCVSCGGEGERACKITDKGKPCDEGLKRALNGICRITPAEATKRAALKQLAAIASHIPEMIGAAFKINGNKGINAQVESGELEAGDSVPSERCPGPFRSMSLGGGGEIGFIVNVEGEAGWAWNCKAHDPDVKMYESSSVNYRLGGGATVAGTLGFWVTDADNLRGLSHGYVADIFDLLGTAQAAKTRDVSKMTEGLKDGIDSIRKKSLKGVPWEVSLGLWFARRDEDGDGKDDEVGQFLGFTVTLGKSLGLDVGGAYIRAKTTQVCDADMKCTEGTWSGRVAGRNGTIFVQNEQELSLQASINDGPLQTFTRKTKHKRDFTDSDGDRLRFRKNYTQLRYRPDGGDETRLVPVVPASIEGAWVGTLDGGAPVGLVVQSRGEETLQVSINNGAPKTFTRGRVFRRSYSSTDGEKLRFRKNFTLLKFEAGDGTDGRLTPGNPNDIPTGPASGSGRIDVLGQWDFTVNGRHLTDEFVEQTDSFVVVRRVGTTIDRRYEKTGENEYSTDVGGTFRFVTDTRALWISPDRKTVFQYNKKAE